MKNKVISISKYKITKNKENKKNKTAIPQSFEAMISEQYTDKLADEFNKLINKKN